MRFWWVNHKQTVEQEVGEGYLWSPVREAGGARSQFYNNMRVAMPGDLVISYAHGLIKYVGQVDDFAIPAPKPNSFGSTGAYWSDKGWLLPVSWEALGSPVRPKDKLDQFSALLPTKYSPISPKTGGGSQKAYLAEISQGVFEVVLGRTAESFSMGGEFEARPQAVDALEKSIEKSIADDVHLDETTKRQMVLARKGQGLFRSNVEARGGAVCRLTGVQNAKLLTASHIQPWRVCTTASERLSGANGLMLAPHVDRLFDRGFISFENDGKVLVSRALKNEDLMRLGLSEAVSRGTAAFDSEQSLFLEYHRSYVFLK